MENATKDTGAHIHGTKAQDVLLDILRAGCKSMGVSGDCGGKASVHLRKGESHESMAQGKVTAKKLTYMVQSQLFRCGMSGVELQPSTASVDHIVPCCDGGHHAMENLMAVHNDINRLKSTFSLEDAVGMCCAVADLYAKGGGDIDAAALEWRERKSQKQ